MRIIEQMAGEAIRILVAGGQPWMALALALAIAILLILSPAVWKILPHGPPPPEWDPEKGTGPLSPPLDMPPGGAPLDQAPPKDWI